MALGIAVTVLRFLGNEITTPTIVLVAHLLISGSQFMLFAMWALALLPVVVGVVLAAWVIGR